jgi:NAD(P)-dependent dehydrogenase (short-subunit alcohol dehydrogenase family)
VGFDFADFDHQAGTPACGALPVGRAGEASDLARSYLHLMEQEYATGSILTVDGGGVLI